jgi:hypothetical protein
MKICYCSLTFASLILLTSCPGSQLTTRVLLVSPLDTACIRSTLSSLTHLDIVSVQRKPERREHKAFARFTTSSGSVRQVVTTDSTVYLQASMYREPDDVFADSRLLFQLRDGCGGQSPRSQGFTIQSESPLYEEWLVEGTQRRVMLRWIRDEGEYRVQVDTMADGRSPERPPWLRVHSHHLPTPPKNYVIGTECARVDGPTTAAIVAIARKTTRPFLGDVVEAWELTFPGLAFAPVTPALVRCRNTGWGGRWETF